MSVDIGVHHGPEVFKLAVLQMAEDTHLPGGQANDSQAIPDLIEYDTKYATVNTHHFTVCHGRAQHSQTVHKMVGMRTSKVDTAKSDIKTYQNLKDESRVLSGVAILCGEHGEERVQHVL